MYTDDRHRLSLNTLEKESGPIGPVGPAMRVIRGVVPVAVSLALLSLLAWKFDGWSALRNVDLRLLVIGAGVALLLDCGLAAVKWWWITRLLGLQIPFRRAWLMLNASRPLAFFMPFQSGQALPAIALARIEGVSYFVAAESIILDKANSLVSLFALAAVGQLLLPTGHPLQQTWILALAILPVVALFFMDPILSLAGRVPYIRERSHFLSHPLAWHQKLRLLGLSMVCQSAEMVSMFFACAALGLSVDPVVILAGYPAVCLLSLIPITFSGFGLRETLTVSFFSLAQVLPEDSAFDAGVSAGLLVDLLEFVGPAVFGLVALPWLVRQLWRPRRPGA